MASLAAVGFSGASLLALLGGQLGARGRSYSAAFAAGILLALAFVDLFPEGLELGGEAAVAGFVGGFALLFMTEAFTRAHTHQIPVGISLAAVLIAARVGRAGVMRAAVLLGLAIPVAAALTVTIPAPGPGALGLLTGVAGGVLAYIGAAHLLPEAQAEDANKLAGIMFVVTFVITAAGLIAFQRAA